MRIKTIIMGAAGRDFHNFNVIYRDSAVHEVVAFTAAQIPDIAGRAYPASLAGPLYPKGIPIHAESDRLIKDYTVLCKSSKQKVKMLSGGNIQKVVVAREFSSDPTLIIADQPTRGIDVGATEFIRKKLVDLSRAGTAVLLVSADLNEVMELSDSLIVLYGGKIAAYFEDTSQLNDEMMGEYMLGIKRQSDEEIGRVCHER